MSVAKKYEFLKTVEMPKQKAITQCLKEYIHFKGPFTTSGKYGYFVDHNNDDLVQSRKGLNTPEAFTTFMSSVDGAMDKGLSVEIGDFIHVYVNKEYRTETECRLYLRIMPSAIFDLAAELGKACANRQIPTHFKFSHIGREDSLVLYTDYDHVQEFVDIINQVKKARPELFKNSERIHPLWGKVDGYIGFMEEPSLRIPPLDKSANTYRTRIFEDMANFFEDKPEFYLLTTSFLSKFTLKYDISPTFFPLNESSVRELEAAGFDLSQIGVQASAKNMG